MSSGNFERINQSNRGELKRVQDKKGGIKEELGDAPEEIVVNMLPLLQRRLPTTSAFTASDTEALLPNGDGDVNARTECNHETHSVLVRRCYYVFHPDATLVCGKEQGIRSQLRRIGSKERRGTTSAPHHRATCGALGGGKGRCRVCRAHSARNTTECS